MSHPLREGMSSGNDPIKLKLIYIVVTSTTSISKMTNNTPAATPGRFTTIRLTLYQNPFSLSDAASTFGMNGQKARRPIKAKILGINVKPAMSITTTAMENTGAKRSEEHTSELQSRGHLVCRLLLEN